MRIRTRLVLLAALLLCACGGSVTDLVSTLSLGPGSPPEPWPPVVGERYPDLELRDWQGERVQLSSYEGKVLLIEPIGMT